MRFFAKAWICHQCDVEAQKEISNDPITFPSVGNTFCLRQNRSGVFTFVNRFREYIQKSYKEPTEQFPEGPATGAANGVRRFAWRRVKYL